MKSVYINLDEDRRIGAMSVDFHCGPDEWQIEVPGDFDIETAHNYRYVEGALVHDPLPEPEPLLDVQAFLAGLMEGYGDA